MGDAMVEPFNFPCFPILAKAGKEQEGQAKSNDSFH